MQLAKGIHTHNTESLLMSTSVYCSTPDILTLSNKAGPSFFSNSQLPSSAWHTNWATVKWALKLEWHLWLGLDYGWILSSTRLMIQKTSFTIMPNTAARCCKDLRQKRTDKVTSTQGQYQRILVNSFFTKDVKAHAELLKVTWSNAWLLNT